MKKWKMEFLVKYKKTETQNEHAYFMTTVINF